MTTMSMTLIPLLCFVAGAAALVVGFKRKNRAILSIAAVLWLASGTWSDFAIGFGDGWTAGASAAPQTRAG